MSKHIRKFDHKCTPIQKNHFYKNSIDLRSLPLEHTKIPKEKNEIQLKKKLVFLRLP